MRHSKGFTIVELLIVIVVIAILAAVTIVAYTGVQNKARVSSVTSALQQASKKLATYHVENGEQYPAATGTDGIANLASLGIANTSGVTYQYSATNTTYCLTATTGPTSYKLSNTNTTPTSGGCPGHGVGGAAAITNLANNPGSEATALTLSNGGGATMARSTTISHSGAAHQEYGLRLRPFR